LVRDANFADIPAICRLLEEAHTRSHYAKDGSANIDVAEAKRLLVASIQRHGNIHGGGCYVQVADSGAGICGLVLGTLVRVYAIYDKLMASDIFWLVNDHAHPRDAMVLMKGMIAWAKSSPHVIEIKCGTTAIINDDPAKAGRILEHLGMKPYGHIFRMPVHSEVLEKCGSDGLRCAGNP